MVLNSESGCKMKCFSLYASLLFLISLSSFLPGKPETGCDMTQSFAYSMWEDGGVHC